MSLRFSSIFFAKYLLSINLLFNYQNCTKIERTDFSVHTFPLMQNLHDNLSKLPGFEKIRSMASRGETDYDAKTRAA